MSQKLEPIYSDDGQRVATLFRDKKSDMIYSIVSIKNKKHKFSTKVKFPNISRAKREANLRLAELLGTNKKNIAPLVKDEIPNYLLLKESEGLDQKTLALIRRIMSRIEKYWGDHQTSEITRDKIPGWFGWLNEQYPGQQRFNDVKYLRNFCRHLHATQWNKQPMLPAIPIIIDPDHKKVIASRRVTKGRIFTEKEFKVVFHQAPSRRESLLALIMYTMATRIEETLGLRFSSEIIKIAGKWAYGWSYGQNKADLEGYHFLHPKLVPLIEELDGTGLLFPQERNKKQPLKPQQIDWDLWRTRANLGWHWTSHTFRHTCLSNLFSDEKVPQALICKLYRCSLATALATYVKPNQSGREKMRAALEVAI